MPWANRQGILCSLARLLSIRAMVRAFRVAAYASSPGAIDMVWPIPLYNRGRVDAAGRDLIDETVSGAERDVALEIINNWRAAHHYPLLAIRITLQQRARRVEPNSVAAQRLKKLSSIEAKLQRNLNMQLSQMQDIGGCRVVLAAVSDADRLVDVYRESDLKNPSRSKRAREPYDYITHPKSDGYRGVHLIYKYQSSSATHSVYDGQRIEIQIRSRLQHAWATTVEVVDTITRESIKTGGGDPEWRRFFVLMASAMAMVEKRPLVQGTPENRADLHAEIAALASHLDVVRKLQAYVVSVEIDRRVTGKVFLLTLNLETQVVTVRAFKAREAPEASAAYLAAEKENSNNPNMNAVLVTLDDLRNLRSAYPNYHLDTREFIVFLSRIVGGGRRAKQVPER